MRRKSLSVHWEETADSFVDMAFLFHAEYKQMSKVYHKNTFFNPASIIGDRTVNPPHRKNLQAFGD